MQGRVFGDVVLRESKQRGGWLEAIFLEVDESAGELNEAFVEEIVLGAALCQSLDRERSERRGGEDIGGMFENCPGLDEATILVGSSNGRTFDRVGVYFGPYVAGPYAEGAYELDFPMTQAMLDAVKPAYRAAFSAAK